MEKSDSTEERTDIRATDKGKRTEKTAQLSAGRQTAAEAVSEEEIQRHGAIRKVEHVMKKTIFEEMGGTYRQVGDYLIPNLSLPEKSDYQIGKYGRLRRNYLKEYHPVLYANFLTSGTLHRHLAEIDQACNERMEIIVSAMAKREDVTEALKAADQMEWVRRMNSIRNRAEEIVLTELVYE